MRFPEKPRRLLQLSSRFLIAAVVFIAVAAHGQDPADAPAQFGMIYSGGSIITYQQTGNPEAYRTVDALGTTPTGKILFAGTLDEVKAKMDEKGFLYGRMDLGGMTMIPGFFDGHSHFVQVAYLKLFSDLLPPPDGGVTSIEQIQDSLVDHRKATRLTVDIKGAEPGKLETREVVLGNGYDDSRLKENRHPTRSELDQVSDKLGGKGNKDILICVFHQSGHYSVCNTAALHAAGYYDATSKTKETENPTGGTIYRDANRVMTGLLGEQAHINMLMTVVPKIDDKTLIDGLKFYTSQGFTTVEDGRVSPEILPRLAELSPKFSVDVVAYADLQMIKARVAQNIAPPKASRTYPAGGHYRAGGVKLTLDGSPQGRSAWLTERYWLVPQGEEKEYRGNGNIEAGILRDLLVWAYQEDLGQVLMHANGDATIDELIQAERAAREKVQSKENRRTVLLHGQFLRDRSIDENRDDQIRALRELKIFPSLFPMHTYYWGDWYLQIVGNPRASFISPTKAVQNAEMLFSIHSDAPVTKPNSMRLLDSAVNRMTRGGELLGQEQTITPIVALKAMTIWPAYQHFEETTKGSIEVGKNADLVILSHNPLTLLPRKDLICIQIVATVKDGNPVYATRDKFEEIKRKFETCAGGPATLKAAP